MNLERTGWVSPMTRCKVEGCTREAIFGTQWGIRMHCGKHRLSKDVDVVSKRCVYADCDSFAKYGVPGKGKSVCAKHRSTLAGAVYLAGTPCEQPGCGSKATCGVPGEKVRVCGLHKDLVPGAKYLGGVRCKHPGCDALAVYGAEKRRERCRLHKQHGDEDLVNRRCAVSDCAAFVYAGYKYCATHDMECRRKSRVREKQVKNYFVRVGLKFDAWDKQLEETACGRYRPDCVFDRETHAVIVEVDEFQHKAIGYTCDNTRMLDILAALGGRSAVFLRFNPDPYTLAGMQKRTPIYRRLKELDKQLRAALDTVPDQQLTIVRLFYDNPEACKVVTTWVCPDDPTFTEHSV